MDHRSLLLGSVACFFAIGCSSSSTTPGKVLTVGSFGGKTGQFTTIQSAVDQAKPGDWILIGPGDYRETASVKDGVFVTTPGIHLRGMDRAGVIVDGTLVSGTACNPAPAAQNIVAAGRNGIEVYKTDGVTIENMTVCNFLS